MNAIIAGSASGLLFSSLLITVGSFIIFFLLKSGQSSVKHYFADLTATRVILTIILALNPICAVTGVLFAFAFTVLHQGLPRYNIAANNGFEVGGQLRDEFAKEMTPVQIEEAQKLYRECVKANYIWC